MSTSNFKRFVDGKIIDMTDEEIAVRQAEEKAFADGTEARNLGFLREQRNKKLAETDWTQCRDVTLGDDADWKKYRQELRDITKTYKSLADVKWPTKP